MSDLVLAAFAAETGAHVVEEPRARRFERFRQSFDEAAFRAAHDADPMARDKLAEGIAGFSKAIVALEKLLGERRRALTGRVKVGQAAHDFFQAYDLDGDGAITREEWAGSLAVFLALDADGDGKITPGELAAGIGGAFMLAK